MCKESSNSFYIGIINISSSIFMSWLNSTGNEKPLKKNNLKIFLPHPEKHNDSIDNYDNSNIHNNQNLSQESEKDEKDDEKKNEKKNKNKKDKNENKIKSDILEIESYSESEDDGYQSDNSSLADELEYTNIDSNSIPPEYQQELLLSHSELTTESDTDSVSRYISTITRVNRYKNLLTNIFSFKSSPNNLPNNQNQKDDANKQ